MGLTLGHLLSIPRWRDAEILAGDDHLDGGIVTVQIEPSLGVRAIKPASMVVISSPVARSDWRIDALIHRIAAVGATVVVIDGVVPLIQASRMLADRLGVVVLGVARHEILELALLAREILAESVTVRAKLVLEANRKLMKGFPEPASIGAVLEEVLGVPIAIVDRHNSCIVGQANVPSIVFDRPGSDQWTDGDHVYTSTPVHEPGAATFLWLVARCPSGVPGWIEAVNEVLTLGAGALQRWRSALRLRSERDSRFRSMLLTELLQLTGPPSSGLRLRVQETDWLVDGWHLGFFFSGASSVATNELLREVGTELRRCNEPYAIAEHANGCAGWFTYVVEPDDVDVAATVAALRACHRTIRRDLEAFLGVGRLRVGPRGISETIGEAMGGARLAERRIASGHFVDVSRFGVTDLLLAWTRTESFMPAAQDLLAPIEGIGGELVRTLTAYLDSESSLTETAAVLGIHRNTVAARIQRIRELIRSDLSDPDERLAIHLACHAVTRTEESG